MREQMITTLNFYPNRNPKLRFFALWYFTILLIVWTIAGHSCWASDNPIAAHRRGRRGLRGAIPARMGGCQAMRRALRFTGGMTNS